MEEAVGKSYDYDGFIVDIVANKDILGETFCRVYSICELKQGVELVYTFSLLLDEKITVQEINETIEKINSSTAVNGHYYGNLGLVFLKKDTDKYDLMLKVGD